LSEIVNKEEMSPVVDEAAFIIRAQKGDNEAFRELVELYKRRAYFIALGLVGNHDDALDLSQMAFIRVHKALKKFKPELPFYPWFYKILRNLCFNHNSSKKRHGETSLDKLREDNHIQFETDAYNPAEIQEQNERHQMLWKTIKGLSADHREIIILKHFQELPYKEISELLEIPIGTVMSRLYNARQAIKEKMSEYMDS
jgi:RNA polymerase sigma-70 factor, ECF subfamily